MNRLCDHVCPGIVGIIGDFKEQKEAVRTKRSLAYAPRCDQAIALRALTRAIS